MTEQDSSCKSDSGKRVSYDLWDYLHEELTPEDFYGVKTNVSSSRVMLYLFRPADKALVSFLLVSLLR